MNGEENGSVGLNPKIYVRVWAALIFLTAVTVSLAGMRLGRAAIVLALAIASLKSGLVLAYFMHLKYEKHLIFKVMIPLTLAVLVLFVGIVFLDAAYR